MPRLFTGLQVPDPAANMLMAARPPGLRGARLVSRGQLHITLHFVGGVTSEQARKLESALAGITSPPFFLEIAGVGAFPSSERPKILWAGVSASDPLKSLRDGIGRVMDGLGLAVERREYRPHITLARLGGASPHGGWGQQFFAKSEEVNCRYMVHEFILYSVEKGAGEAKYQPRRSYPLSG